MRVVNAPETLLQRSVFLAGSIENGAAENWQKRFIDEFPRYLSQSQQEGLTVFNPRRDVWNPQASSADVREQIAWEHAAMERADVIAMFFDPATKSPITLQEQGMYATSGKLLIYCTPEFWRYDNVMCLANANGTIVVRDWDNFLSSVAYKLFPRRGI